MAPAQLLQMATVHMSWEDALASFILLKKAQGMRERTLRDYTEHVGRFYRQFPEAFAPAKTRLCVLAYLGQPVAPATFNMRRKYLRCFFDWCIEEGIYPRNPTDGVKARKAEPRIVDTPLEAIKALLALCDTGSFCGIRDRALILLQIDSGIRPGEALRLTPADVDLPGLSVRVRPENAKTGRSRTLPLAPQTAQAIKALLSVRLVEWGDVPLFCTEGGTPMPERTWCLRLTHGYSKRLGTHIRPYDLRHMHALSFLRQGGSLFALQKEMGHSDLSMTRRYAAITDADVRTEHAKASPLNIIAPIQVRAPRKVKG